MVTRARGEIGKHVSFRSLWTQVLGGSSPLAPTVPESNYHDYFRGKKITVMGLGLLGRGLGDVKFLAECDADLIVTDLKTEAQLASSLRGLGDFKNITYHLGGHDLADFANRDLILKAAGVPFDSPFIAAARQNGIPIVMSAALFVQLAAPLGVKIIGVTGTRGKSTVTHLIHHILQEGLNHSEGVVGRTIRPKRIVLGGNVRGVSTLALLKEVKSGDLVVLELDSWHFQGFF